MKRLPRGVAAILAAVGLLATACGQNEAPSNKARANAPLKIPQAQLEGGGGNATADEALKERLARQEAATKLFDKSKPEAPKPEPARAPAEPKAAPASEPVRLAASAPVSVGTAAQKLPEPEPVKMPEPAAPPKAEVVAAAKPATVPAPVPPAIAAAKLVSRVDPDFPREAVQAGAEVGHVKARMTLDGNGNVTRVEVVEATPRRLFDRSVVRALSQWRFNDGPSGRTVETEVDFKLK